MYKFRNGNYVKFEERKPVLQHKNSIMAKCDIPPGTIGTVIHTDKRLVYIEIADGDRGDAVVEVPDWDHIEYTEPHESLTHAALQDAATYMASRCMPGGLAEAIVHEDHGRQDWIEEQLRFMRASSSCYAEADKVSEGFHVGERAWLAECEEEAQ